MTEPREFAYDENNEAGVAFDDTDGEYPDSLEEMLRADDEWLPPDPAIDEAVTRLDQWR